MSGSARLLASALCPAALLSCLAAAVGSHLLWNWTPSLPRGLYWLSHDRTAQVGSLVAFPVPKSVERLVIERKYLPPGAWLVKPVVATSGDRVCTDARTLVVDGQNLGRVLTEDSAQRPLPWATVCGPLSEGQVFVASHYEKSFDSRTFGPVPLGALRGTVTPLWTY
jgi:conjugative transfer signal peptidase TraF